ncbi:hypothetical protein PENARI_c009G01689 [Penicillium arizonense]|uniref:VHS domain-containing protein n=1 Tax=Penicillium arizonense TaxID=1835702 RepID=A0A1F5LHH4_PENAI|nr:hypothetical protein PENARI_c009G01689 [Penicillium arizonense]OGE52664.1 hypothetical protein PENARI_c009G01689 [Penicillium arizonense]
MSPFSGDGVLWLCLGVSLFFAVRGIATDLRHVVDLTEIKQVENDDKIISEGTEEALKLDTLLKLSQSTSHDLRAAALRIISERSTKGDTRDLLLEQLASKHKISQGRALNALNFLVSNRAQNVPEALEAGIISRWLCKYPFPCAQADPSRRRDVVILMKTWWSDDAVMSSIFSTLSSHPDGIKQLRKYGLMGSMIEENDQDDEDDDADSDVWMVDADEAGGTFGRSSRRLQEGTPREQALRRRRREAMVLSDGGRPLGNDDIIQRPIE